MTVTVERMTRYWAELAGATGGRQFVSRRIEEAAQLDVHAALRVLDGSPCLLFDLPDPGRVADAGFEVGGMRLARAAGEEGQLLVLSLEDRGRRDLFATLCADLLNFSAGTEAGQPFTVLLDRLEAWRLFLRSLASGMDRSEIIGLLGELYVLSTLLPDAPELLATWRAPDDGLHDFENAGHALEVKTTTGPGSRVRISTLDQLDVTGLDRLDLMHVRLVESPQGQTMDELIATIDGLLGSPAMRRDFSNGLLRRGLQPDDAAARTGVRSRLQQIVCYGIVDAFPRLTRAAVPAPIIDASYALDLSAVQGFAGPSSTTIDAYRSRST